MAIKTNVISHFYNEEFLLPYWLKHHRSLFDHGIMINYNSTDRSVEIIRELCPTWEIVNTRNAKGWSHPVFVDDEVEDIERSLDGWKVALNTTEFIFHYDLKSYLAKFEKENPDLSGVRFQGIYMFDPPELMDVPADPLLPLVLQRHFGSKELDFKSRSRLLHKHHQGFYVKPGRHHTMWKDVIFDRNLYLLWYNFSPYAEMRDRGLSYRAKHINDCKKSGINLDHDTLQLTNHEAWNRHHEEWRTAKYWLADGMEQPVYDLLSDLEFRIMYDELTKRWMNGNT